MLIKSLKIGAACDPGAHVLICVAFKIAKVLAVDDIVFRFGHAAIFLEEVSEENPWWGNEKSLVKRV
ncbi:hypothetical protein SARC_05720 [Sphaeroforma arctica JP610]|uniref:Uncharacterized protein n=1 Tax=Sphaeroforma arctica JP610 TaxID=667725 RepID=A0A0L0FZK1_9EUKA|nr:hypothetical protein SARC_05720 [Sphaeroforma arctica JP610]KNC81991.1 hypothetical protein SARC_05720 [Sphaeroforma arctica JP610]|eukprot:XP_014155893.1 hypothetical protein SARC_05720 [Sphaeroforma arctica JP610]